MLVNFTGDEGFLVSEKKDGFVVLTSSRKRAIHKKSVIYVQSYCIAKKKHFIWVSMYLARKC